MTPRARFLGEGSHSSPRPSRALPPAAKKPRISAVPLASFSPLLARARALSAAVSPPVTPFAQRPIVIKSHSPPPSATERRDPPARGPPPWAAPPRPTRARPSRRARAPRDAPPVRGRSARRGVGGAALRSRVRRVGTRRVRVGAKPRARAGARRETRNRRARTPRRKTDARNARGNVRRTAPRTRGRVERRRG